MKLLGKAAALVAAFSLTLFESGHGVDTPACSIKSAATGGVVENLIALQEENLQLSCDFSNLTAPSTWSVEFAGQTQYVQAEPDCNGRGNFEAVYLKTPAETGELLITVNAIDTVNENAITEVPLTIIGGGSSLAPLFVLILVVIWSKDIYLAMFFAIWTGAYVTTQNFKDSFFALGNDFIVPAVGNADNQYIVLFSVFLGGFLAIISKAGGQIAFAKAAAQVAKNGLFAQLFTALTGLVLFFDDYTNALLVGSTFRPITDTFFISREKLAFLVDSTSAPIASLVPVSSWIAFELGEISGALENVKTAFPNDDNVPEDELTFFLDTIPTRFYPFFMLFIQFTLIFAGREFGPMLLAERRCVVQKRTDGGDGAADEDVKLDLTQPNEDTPKKIFNFLIPVGFLIVVIIAIIINTGSADLTEFDLAEAFKGGDSFSALLIGSLGSALFAAGFYLLQTKEDGMLVPPSPQSLLVLVGLKKEGPKPLMSLSESTAMFIEGIKNLTPTVIILLLAFTLKITITACATDRLITDAIVNGDVSGENLPTIVFLISAMLSWITGTSWGTMSIMFPLISIAAWEKSGGDEILFTTTLSQILAGAIFGDHSSFLSDTTILSSIGAGCKVGRHVITQIPYALFGATFAVLLGTLPAGAGAPGALMLVIGGAVMCVSIFAVGVPVVSSDGRYDIFTTLYAKITGSADLETLKEETIAFAAENNEMTNVNIVSIAKGLRSGSGAVVETKPETSI